MSSPILTSDEIHKHIGKLDPEQVNIWRAMSPARRLDLARHAADAARSQPGQVRGLCHEYHPNAVEMAHPRQFPASQV